MVSIRSRLILRVVIMVLRGISFHRFGSAGCFSFTRRALDCTPTGPASDSPLTFALGTVPGAAVSLYAVRIGSEGLRRICRLPDSPMRKGGCHDLSL